MLFSLFQLPELHIYEWEMAIVQCNTFISFSGIEKSTITYCSLRTKTLQFIDQCSIK